MLLVGVTAGYSSPTNPNQSETAIADAGRCESIEPIQIKIRNNESINLAPVPVEDKFYVYVAPPPPPPAPAPTTRTRQCTAQEMYHPPADCIPLGGLYGPPAVG